MKRFFALLLALMLCLSLCACGNKSGDDMQSESSGTKEFENVILADNDAVKIELVNFYAKDENWAHLGEIIEKGFTMRITNKTSSTIGFTSTFSMQSFIVLKRSKLIDSIFSIIPERKLSRCMIILRNCLFLASLLWS